MSSPSVIKDKKNDKGSGKHNKKAKKGTPKGEKTPSVASSNRSFATEELDDLSMESSVLSKPMTLLPQFIPGFFEDKATENC